MIHELKIKPKFFQDIINGIKNFEIRKNDRMFRIGDILVLSEFDYAVLMIGNCFESKVQAAMYKNYYVHLYKGYQNEKYKRN